MIIVLKIGYTEAELNIRRKLNRKKSKNKN